ncbi:MAG: hypothetical protein H6718_27570 [Polyangiaceae bacterium]|nr:hypothetical protein [Myxococcales bacterium]MCB9589204.1 hypothetical protein [Polyangiaceae bacterium]
MSALRVKLAALLALVALLLPATSVGRVLTLCKMSGRMGASCCCHGDAHQRAAKKPQPAKAERPGCCEQRLTKTTQVLSAQSEADLPPSQAVLVAELSLPEASEPRLEVEEVPRVARGPPPLGPPLYLKNCSFLI